MTVKIFALASAFFLLFSQPSFLLGQTAPTQQNWEAVQAVSVGTKLFVERKDGKKFKGNLKSASATTLVLTGTDKTIDLNKDDIRKVYQLGGGSRAKSALLGAAIGGGIGAGAAFLLLGATNGSDDAGGIVGTGIAIGAGVGVALGLLVGKSGKRVLIYESN